MGLQFDLIDYRVMTDLDVTQGRRRRRGRATRRGFATEAPLSDTHFAFACGPWWVLIELDEVGGQVEPVRVDVRGFASTDSPSAAPVTSLRDIPLKDMVKRAITQYRTSVEEGKAVIAERQRMDEELRELAISRADKQLAAARGRKGKGGRPPLPAEEVMLTLETYLQFKADPMERSDPGYRSPRQRTADELVVSISTVDKRLARARQLGLPLATSPRGLASAGTRAKG